MSATTDPTPVTWVDDAHLTVNGVPFRLFETRSEASDDLLLFKWPALVREYLALAPELHGGTLVELGIFRGGSTAFLAELYQPRSLVAVELEPTPPELLVEHLRHSDVADRVHCHFGVDQADRATLRRLVADDIGDAVDCVVDDASHLLGPTMVSCEVLLPLVRPGGLYIIEDWSGWLSLASAYADRHAKDPTTPADREAAFAQAMADDPRILLAVYARDPASVRDRLGERPSLAEVLRAAHPEAVEAMLATRSVDDVAELLGVDPTEEPPAPAPAPAATTPAEAPAEETNNLAPLVAHLQQAALTAPELIASVRVRRGAAIVRRGPAPLDPDGFDLLSLTDSGLRWPDGGR